MSVFRVLDAAGSQAGQIASLWWPILWLFVGVFALVVAALAWAVARGRGVAGPMPPLRPRRETGVAMIVGGAVLATVIVLFVFLGFSVSVGRALGGLGQHDPVSVEVTGHQWWWQVQYDATVPADRVVTANEIHLPVGRPVLLKLVSRDVIHSFWVPNLAGKKDLIPGHPSSLWIQAEREGVFRGQCAEFCGLQHAHMGLLVVAESPERFEAWRTAQRQPAAEPAAGSAARGRDVFLASRCVLCHAIRGTSASASVAPDLTHVASRLTLGAGAVPNTPEHLAGWIQDPQRPKPGNYMPANPLEPQPLADLVAYLGALR